MVEISKSKLDEMLFSYKNSNSVVLGTNKVLSLIKSGKLMKVILSLNVNDDVLSSIEHYAKLNNVEIVKTTLTNVELGTFFRKPFLVTVAGILNEE